MGRGIQLGAAALLAALAGASAPAREPRINPASVVPAITYSTPDRFASRILELHNHERERLGLRPLAWNGALATAAADWARTLAATNRFEHSPGEIRGRQGENLFRGTAGHWLVDEMIGGFLEERADFRPGRFPEIAINGDWQTVGHYSQMIWRGTREVGCAVARGQGWDYLACRYAPAGNIVGQRVP